MTDTTPSQTPQPDPPRSRKLPSFRETVVRLLGRTRLISPEDWPATRRQIVGGVITASVVAVLTVLLAAFWSSVGLLYTAVVDTQPAIRLGEIHPTRVRPLDGLKAVVVDNKPIYPRGAELRLEMFLQAKTGSTVAVTAVRPKVNVTRPPDPRLAYSIDPNLTPGKGVVEPLLFLLALGHEGVTFAAEILPDGQSVQVKPDNLLYRDRPRDLRLSSGASSSGDTMEAIIVRVRANDPGHYDLHFEVDYILEGRLRQIKSDTISLFEQAPRKDETKKREPTKGTEK